MANDIQSEPRRKDDMHPTRELSWTEPAPAGAKLSDVMVDTETMGTAPGSAILSIGAVMFGPAGLGDEFYAPISLASCTAVGLTIDPKTVEWWMKQSDAARAAALSDEARELPVALLQFASWLAHRDIERLWCHGANFDAPLLDAAYRACYLTTPWKYWNVRDTRTLYEQADVKVDRTRGTHHNALDDAKTQAEAAVVALRRLQDMRAPISSGQQDAVPWSKEPPTEHGEYWNWDGNNDHAPMICHVLWSGTAKKCFVSMGQYGIAKAIWCDSFGGWWTPIVQPHTPPNTVGR